MAALSRLIWVGSCSNRNLLAPPNFLQIAPQQPRRFVLYKDFVFELIRITDLHELMRVARIAILAGELAAAIGIDGPGKGKIAMRVAAVENGTNRQ